MLNIVFYFLINKSICNRTNNNIKVMFESAFYSVLENEFCPFRSESFKDFNSKSFLFTLIGVEQKRIDCDFSTIKENAAFTHLPSPFPIWSEIEAFTKIIFAFTYRKVWGKYFCITSM